MNEIKLFIDEDQEVLREAYKLLLPAHQGVLVQGVVENGNGADDGFLAQLGALDPDILLIGRKELQPEIVEELEVLRDQFPRLAIVLLSGSYSVQVTRRLREFASRLLANGRSRGYAFLLKYSVDSIGQLVEVVHAVAQGRIILDPAIMGGFIGEDGSSVLKELTVRELEILSWMAKGYKNTTIAELLCLESKTVERHINHIYSKLNTTFDESQQARVQTVLLYLRATGQLPSTPASPSAA